jgi:hypothetical protein
LSKILDYLIDNLCVSMLSELRREGQQESGLAESVGSKMGIWLRPSMSHVADDAAAFNRDNAMARLRQW